MEDIGRLQRDPEFIPDGRYSDTLDLKGTLIIGPSPFHLDPQIQHDFAVERQLMSALAADPICFRRLPSLPMMIFF